MIKIKNLTKTFIDGERKVQALRDITFDVPEGQFLTITGKSGSGKSTLLYQLGLLDIPTSGVIEIDGVDMIKLNETDNKKLNLLLEKVGGKGCFLETHKLNDIIKDEQNNYELTFNLQKSSDSYVNPSVSIKYKTKDFKSIIPASIL